MHNPKAKCDQVLVQKMIPGERELVVGFTRDFQFGPCVMFGLGGIFAELFRDVSFRLPPLTEQDALEMMSDIKSRKILEDFRGNLPVDKENLARILISAGNIGIEYEAIREIDINPLIVQANGVVIAVDALIGLSPL
jgi:succinyl-CoA synthetase beta subunit